MIIDAHMHIWDKVNGLVQGSIPVKPHGKGMITIGKTPMLGMPATLLDCGARAEYVLAEFDAAGVDAGVVVQEYLDGEQNDYMLKTAKKYPGRFFMHGLPNFYKPEGVAREASRLFARGFRGLKFPAGHFTAVKLTMDDKRFMPIYEEMEAAGHVMAVDLSVGAEQVPGMERVLKAHPKLKVAVGHFGLVTRGKKDEWLTQIRLARHENVFIESGGIIWLFRDESWPFPGAIKAFKRAIKEVGVEKLMWASDWPRTMVDFTYRQSISFLRDRDNGLSDAQKSAILGGNAMRLFGFKKPAKARPVATLITAG
jgi:predicted TIM-barrel fold metal-dependent hydrolase